VRPAGRTTKKGHGYRHAPFTEMKKDRGQRFCRRSRSFLYSILLNQSWDIALADPRMSVRHHQFRFPFPLMDSPDFLTEKITFANLFSA
jgi:hypothetical protein